MMRSILYVFFVLVGTAKGWGQSEAPNTFSFDDYLAIVKKHHPVAFQASLKLEEGEAYVQKAKGNFDPKLSGQVNQKYFEGKQYYSYINGGLKIPTWFGVELEAGYVNTDGVQLNPESYTPYAGIWKVGASLNLLNGLMIDQRRADLKQATLIKSSTALEAKLMMNQLVYDASNAYLQWAKAFDKVMLYDQNIKNIEERYLQILKQVELGDKSAVDTLKVHIQIQDRLLKLEQAVLDLNNKKTLLNLFLWQDGLIPLEIDSVLVPSAVETLWEFAPDWSIQAVVGKHPEVLMQQNDVSSSKIDYRLKRENLKPDLTLKYNALSGGSNTFENYAINDYQVGASFAYPIFTRKTRADVKLSGLKIDEKQAKLAEKRATVDYKVKTALNQLASLQAQVEIQAKAVDMYRQLLEAETKLFNIGESSLFLINIRDQNLIQAELKLIDVHYQYKQAEASMKYHTMTF